MNRTLTTTIEAQVELDDVGSDSRGMYARFNCTTPCKGCFKPQSKFRLGDSLGSLGRITTIDNSSGFRYVEFENGARIEI
jgi:hypothetical protein